jgi:molybdopterin-synthase adenylyltransferase
VIGPLTIPGKTTCRVCAESLAVNPRRDARPAEGPRAAIMARLLGHLVALEVLAIVSGYTETKLGGRALIQDLTTFETKLATLVRLPWCRVCG